MQATITYLLTEQAQREAMAATGQPVARKQAMTIEVTAEDLPILPVEPDGSIKLDLSGLYSGLRTPALLAAGWTSANGGQRAEATIINPPILADYRRGVAIVAAQEAEAKALAHANGEHNRTQAEAAYQAFLADPTARLAEYSNERPVTDLRTPADWWPPQHEAWNAEIRRRYQADMAVKKADEEAKEQAKRNYIAEWIANYAPKEIREQYTDGLLSRSAALTIIADSVFANAGLPVEHNVIVCKNGNCPCGTKDVDTIPPSVFARYRPIHQLLPEDAMVEFEKSQDCVRDDAAYPDNGASKPYYTALIKLPVGPFTFERRIKI